MFPKRLELFSSAGGAIGGALACALLFCGPARADTNAVPDYGSAFGMFAAFGLETVEPGGQYVALSLDEPGVQQQQPVANVSQLPFLGKAWVWPGTNGQPTRYLFLGGLGGFCRAAEQTASEPAADPLPRASWTRRDADLAKDVAGVLRVLRGPAKDAEADGEEDGSGDYVRGQFAQAEPAGALLLAAVHVHQAGLKDEANEIADLVFRLAQDRSTVVRQAVAHLAQSRYAAAGTRLAATRNWKAYRDELRDVLDRYGTAWDKAPGLEILIAKVDRQIAGTPPAGEGLDEDAARFFADVSPEDVQLLTYLKLAVAINPAVQLGLLSAPEGERAKRFFARGIHVIPALLAVVDSDYLLPAAVDASYSYRYRSYSYSSGDEKGLKSAEEIYKELENKPPVLGDVAAELLNVVVPQPAQPFRGEDGKSNAVAAARAFYAAHAADSPMQLAAHYLAEGDEAQRSSVVETLIHSKDSNVLALAESRLFSSNIWSQSSYSVLDSSAIALIQSYVLQHPERAAAVLPDFLETTKAQLPERLAAMEESRRTREKQNAQRMLKGLEQALRKTQGDSKAAAEPEIQADSPSARQQANMSLMKKTEGLPPREAIGVFLDGIVAQKDAELRQDLLMSFYGVYHYQWNRRNNGTRQAVSDVYQQAQELRTRFDDALFQDAGYAAKIAARAAETRAAAGQADPNAAKPAASGNLVLELAPQWEVLLADRRAPAPNAPSIYGAMDFGSNGTVADTAAFVLASIVLDLQNVGQDRQIEIHFLGSRLNAYWHQVARAALDGTSADDLPPLPSAETVAPETVSNLVARLTAAAPAAGEKTVRELEPDVLLALGQAAEKNEALRKALAPAANRVAGIGQDSVAAFAPLLEPIVGETLSTNLFDRLLAAASTLATQSVAATVTFRREPWLGGTTISIATNQPGGYNPFGEIPNRNEARIFVLCQSSSDNEYALWSVALPAPAAGAAATNAAADPAARMKKLMAQYGVSIEDADISPEMLEQMALAMSDADSESGPAATPEAQAKVIHAVEQFGSGAKSPLAALTITFAISLPPTDLDNQNNEVSDFDDEELYIE